MFFEEAGEDGFCFGIIVEVGHGREFAGGVGTIARAEEAKLFLDRRRGQIRAPAGATKERVVVLLTTRDREPDEDELFGPTCFRSQAGNASRYAPWLEEFGSGRVRLPLP